MLEKIKNTIRYERKINMNTEKIWNLLNDGHSFALTKSKYGIGYLKFIWRAVFPVVLTLLVSVLVTAAVNSIFKIETIEVSGIAEEVMLSLGVIFFFTAIVASYILVSFLPIIQNFTYDKPKIVSRLFVLVINAVLTFVLLSANYGVFSIIY